MDKVEEYLKNKQKELLVTKTVAESQLIFLNFLLGNDISGDVVKHIDNSLLELYKQSLKRSIQMEYFDKIPRRMGRLKGSRLEKRDELVAERDEFLKDIDEYFKNLVN
jgi:hypothetical protein